MIYPPYTSYSRGRQPACCPSGGRYVRPTAQVQAFGLRPARPERE